MGRDPTLSIISYTCKEREIYYKTNKNAQIYEETGKKMGVRAREKQKK